MSITRALFARGLFSSISSVLHFLFHRYRSQNNLEWRRVKYQFEQNRESFSFLSETSVLQFRLVFRFVRRKKPTIFPKCKQIVPKTSWLFGCNQRKASAVGESIIYLFSIIKHPFFSFRWKRAFPLHFSIGFAEQNEKFQISAKIQKSSDLFFERYHT